MRIVQVAPDYLQVPPPKYGAIERIVYDLTEELMRRGHDVYLYALPGSRTSARLISYPQSYHDDVKVAEFVKQTLPEDVDIIHDHTLASMLGHAKLPVPTVCTHHFPWNNWVPFPIYVSQRALERIGGNCGYVAYNGVDPTQYEFSAQKEPYMLFLGRLDREKGIHHALEVAERTGQELIVAGPVNDYLLFMEELKPVIDRNPNIRYVGEVGAQQRLDLLKKARCLLFPTIGEEAFGLAMIEAMACGTPVLALNNGAVPEVLHGFPNLVCATVDEMAEKVLREPLPAPAEVLQYVLDNFTVRQMTDRYLELYQIAMKKADGSEG